MMKNASSVGMGRFCVGGVNINQKCNMMEEFG